jgi:hypothetical protein
MDGDRIPRLDRKYPVDEYKLKFQIKRQSVAFTGPSYRQTTKPDVDGCGLPHLLLGLRPLDEDLKRWPCVRPVRSDIVSNVAEAN